MLPFECIKCHELLPEPGGLLFSPPVHDTGTVQKFHICALCWHRLGDEWIFTQ